MTLEFKRLGGTDQQPYCTELQGYSPGVTALLAHLCRLPGVHVQSFRSYAMTDDVWIEFEYEGFPFIIESPFAYLWLTADSPTVTEKTFRQVESHLINFRRASFFRYVRAWAMSWRLPRTADRSVPRKSTSAERP